MKRIFGILFALSAVLILLSCGNRVDWTDSNGYNDAKYLKSTHTESGQNLEINILNSDSYLKDVTKDKIIVKARSTDPNDKEKELTSEELQKDAIKDYTLSVEKDNVKITLPAHEKSIYVVVFNKSITQDKKYAYAYTSLIEEGSSSYQP